MVDNFRDKISTTKLKNILTFCYTYKEENIYR